MRFFTDEVGLVLSNGAAYGQGGEGFVRMNIGCPRKIVKEALGRISYPLENEKTNHKASKKRNTSQMT